MLCELIDKWLCVSPHAMQTVEGSALLLEGALASLTSLLITVLSKLFSSDNLHSIFKVRNEVLCCYDYVRIYVCTSKNSSTMYSA